MDRTHGLTSSLKHEAETLHPGNRPQKRRLERRCGKRPQHKICSSALFELQMCNGSEWWIHLHVTNILEWMIEMILNTWILMICMFYESTKPPCSKAWDVSQDENYRIHCKNAPLIIVIFLVNLMCLTTCLSYISWKWTNHNVVIIQKCTVITYLSRAAAWDYDLYHFWFHLQILENQACRHQAWTQCSV